LYDDVSLIYCIYYIRFRGTYANDIAMSFSYYTLYYIILLCDAEYVLLPIVFADRFATRSHMQVSILQHVVHPSPNTCTASYYYYYYYYYQHLPGKVAVHEGICDPTADT